MHSEPQRRRPTIFTLEHPNGTRLRATDFGAIILSLEVPDRAGRLADVVLGYDHPDCYAANPAYFGAVVGRYANRIRDGRFVLDGRAIQLSRNENGHHLHGGERGFGRVWWEGTQEGHAVTFRYVSADGEEGYPGTLGVRVTYTLTDDGLVVDYHAEADRPTPVSLSQHTYFNLAGHDAGDVLGHRVRVNAAAYTPVGPGLIPTGELRPVAGSAFDLRRSWDLGAALALGDEQLDLAGGFDHNFALDRNGLDRNGSGSLAHAARIHEPASGRVLDVLTSEPGLQLYTGNQLDGVRGKGGAVYGRHAGLCLETQQFPDAPNQPAFPSPILRPPSAYRSRTVFRFGHDGALGEADAAVARLTGAHGT